MKLKLGRIVITDGAQHALEKAGVTTMSYRFASEEVSSHYGYPQRYHPKDIATQIDILRAHWPQLNPDNALRYTREAYPNFMVPRWVEGPFAIVRPGFFSNMLGEEVLEVLNAIALTRELYNYREGQLGLQQLRQHEHTAAMWKKLGEQQQGDILVVPAQFGLHHRGRSVRRAREVMNANEFGLCAFAVGIMLLTHPERLQHHENLWIDCAGDEYAPDAGGDWSRAPLFGFGGGKVEFGTHWFGGGGGIYGSASGFVSQS